MHYKKYKSILSPHNNMNIYRGCTHGCIYCDSRSRCYQMDHDFEDIEVKDSAPEMLDLELSRKRSRGMVGTGAMTDPYIHLEKTLEHTRRCLEAVYDHGFGIAIQTKSDLILRDLDLLIKINERTKCVVQITLTTYDEDICSIVEPDVCTTKRRFEVLQILGEHNIPTVVWFTPLLPFINDNEENVRGIVNYCKKAGVYGIISFGMGMTLRDGNREYFYRKLDESFPGIKERYIKAFGDSYECRSPNRKALQQCFHIECNKSGINYNNDNIFRYMSRFESKYQGEQIGFFNI